MKPISRRAFLKYMAAGALTVGTGAGIVYSAGVEPRAVQVIQQHVALPGLAKAFDGLRAAQISDLHMGSFIGRDQLERVAKLVLDQQPDLILITGDYLTNGGDMKRALADLESALSGFSKQAQVITVLGNHDHNEAEGDLHKLIQKLGFFELPNAIQPINRGRDLLYFAGIDSVSTGHQGLGEVVKMCPSDAPVILLAHEPDMAIYAAPTGKFAFQISGHSHGGQVKLPMLGRMVLPFMGKKYPAGLNQAGDMPVYTNCGIGMVHVPLRVDVPPEITVFTFESKLA